MPGSQRKISAKRLSKTKSAAVKGSRKRRGSTWSEATVIARSAEAQLTDGLSILNYSRYVVEVKFRYLWPKTSPGYGVTAPSTAAPLLNSKTWGSISSPASEMIPDVMGGGSSSASSILLQNTSAVKFPTVPAADSKVEPWLEHLRAAVRSGTHLPALLTPSRRKWYEKFFSSLRKAPAAPLSPERLKLLDTLGRAAGAGPGPPSSPSSETYATGGRSYGAQPSTGNRLRTRAEARASLAKLPLLSDWKKPSA